MNLTKLPSYLEQEYDFDALVYQSDTELYYAPDVPELLIEDIKNHDFMIYSGYYTYHKLDDAPRLYYLGRGKRIGKYKIKIQGFYPYLYDFSDDGEYKTYLGDRCEKFLFKGQHPSKVKKYREHKLKGGYKQPLEADILYCRRYMIDMYDFFKPTEPIQPKVAIVDIETNHPVNDEIISYAINDLETGEIFYESKYDGSDSNTLANNLVNYIKEFDMITGWDFIRFDTPIIEKYSKVRLTNMVTILDLLEISKKMHAREIRGRWSLDNVGSRLCGIAKPLDEDDIKLDIRELNKEKLFIYNIIDCIIPEIINEELGGLEAHIILAWSLQVGIDDVIITAVVNDIALLREYHKAGLVLPSRDYSKEKSKDYMYKAAEPDARPGVYDGIIAMDIIAAYPTAVISRNISPETKDKNGENLTPNGIRYNNNDSTFISTLKQLMKDRFEIREKLKKLDKEHRDYRKYKSIDFSLKTEIAALSHGMFGWGNSRIRDYEIADSITSVVRDLIDKIKSTCDLIGKKWINTHTDSCYIHARKGEKDKIIQYMNKMIENYCKDYKILPELEFKGFYPKGYIHSPARNVLVPEGVDIDDDENWEVSGMNFYRSEVSEPLAKIEIELIKMKLRKEPISKLVNKLRSMLMGLPEVESSKLAVIKPLTKPIEKYGRKLQDGSWGAVPYHVKALVKSQEEFGLKINEGEKFGILNIITDETEGIRKVKMKNVLVAFDLDSGLPSNYKINYLYYLQSNLWGKIAGIMEMTPKELEREVLTDEVKNHLGIEYEI